MEKRIEKEITQMRGDLAMLTELTKDNGISDRKKRKILRRYTIKDERDRKKRKEEEIKAEVKGTSQSTTNKKV